jgi:hypothetical protein
MSRQRILLLGDDHPDLDRFDSSTQADGRTACVLCAGSAATPCKDLGDSPNEDALLVIDEGPHTLLAVADAHYGSRSSRVLLERLSTIDSLPTHPLELLELLPTLADSEETIGDPSETTLLIALIDRERSSGFGVSIGDSTLSVLGLDNPPRTINRKNMSYAQPWVPASLDPRRARDFSFDLLPGELAVAYTDGVDECHYHSPKTSVQLSHMETVHIRTGGDPGRFVGELVGLVLGGVGGNPGGQDNVAVVATRV